VISGKQFKTGLVYDPLYKKHLTGPRHPESPARCDAIAEALAGERFRRKLVRIAPRPASEAEILACHEPEFFDYVKARIAAGQSTLGWPDTNVCGDSLAAALLAAGGVLAAVDAVVARKATNAFCAVRPPGHHASASKTMGFCLFNNVAIAARYARKNYKLARVLIADWDVHHGNGTQEIFYEDPSVLYFSTHQWPWYPGTGGASQRGLGRGAGTTINCPLPAGTGGAEIIAAFEDKLVPAAQKFRPELVLISAGFDSRKNDPLGGFMLTDDDFATLTGVCLDIAREHAGGRLVSVLEGGYDLAGLAAATVSHVNALAGA